MDTSAAGDAELDESVEPFDLGSFPANLRTLEMEQVKSEVKRRFYRFLTDYTSTSGERVYDKAIEEMTAANSPSLAISYLHLSTAQPTFGIWLADMPRQMLALFDDVARQVVLERYPDYR